MSITDPIPVPTLQVPSRTNLIGTGSGPERTSVPSADPATLASWMGIEPDVVLDLAHSGVIPSRVGSKGLTFDVLEIQDAVNSARQTPPYALRGDKAREIALSLSAAPDASEAWRIGASELMIISGGHSALVFVSDPEAWLRPLDTLGAEDPARRSAMESIAAWVAITGLPISVGAPVGSVQPAEDLTGHTAAFPVRLGGRLWGVVALDARGGGHSMGPGRLAAGEAVATQLALVLQRLESQDRLVTQAAITDSNQRQMEAFARDVRSTFAAEKERAEQLAEALDELEKTYLATVKGLAVAVEAKDEYTAGHLQRVTLYGMAMMRIVAPEEALDPQYEFGFLLHDVGKMAIPDAVLKKAGPLTDEEWVVMRSHAEMGRRILKDIPFLAGAQEIVFAHHERWDGKGYPRALEGDEIPLGARVFSIADSFDAMRSDRPYRKALSVEVALSEIAKGRGTQFWAPAVDAFMTIPLEELEAVAAQTFPHLGED